MFPNVFLIGIGPCCVVLANCGGIILMDIMIMIAKLCYPAALAFTKLPGFLCRYVFEFQ